MLERCGAVGRDLFVLRSVLVFVIVGCIPARPAEKEDRANHFGSLILLYDRQAATAAEGSF